MTDRTECEIYLAINEDGDYQVAADSSDAAEYLRDNCGGELCRIVNITAYVAAPVMTQATVVVPDEAGETVQVAAE